MATATSRRVQTSAPTDGSSTITLQEAHPSEADDGSGPSSGQPNAAAVGVLKLRGTQRRTRQRVVWGADVVDNEGCGKNKSKICCIYHKPRRFDESSSESASSSDSDSDDGGRYYDDDLARSTRRCRQASPGHGCRHNTVRREGLGGTVHESDSDVNAYERVPKRNS